MNEAQVRKSSPYTFRVLHRPAAPFPDREERLQRALDRMEEERDQAREDLKRALVRVAMLEQQRLARPAPITPDAVWADRLGDLVKRFHPDRNGGQVDATELTAELNRLRDAARGRR